MGNKSTFTVVTTLLENGTFQYLTSYSISFAFQLSDCPALRSQCHVDDVICSLANENINTV